MTYATKQLTESLQDLTAQRQASGSFTRSVPKAIPLVKLKLPLEVQEFLDTRHEHTVRSRSVNEGRY